MPDFIDIMAERQQMLYRENDELRSRLKKVAKNIEKLIEQPQKCLFQDMICNYPINDCSNCPAHFGFEYGCEIL